jgi:hypothetical protein
VKRRGGERVDVPYAVIRPCGDMLGERENQDEEGGSMQEE